MASKAEQLKASYSNESAKAASLKDAFRERTPLEDFGAGLRAPFSAISAPASSVLDMVVPGDNSALTNQLYSESKAPESMAGQLGEAVSSSFLYGTGISAGATMVPKALSAEAKMFPAVQNFLNEVGVTFRVAPKSTAAVEGLAGGTAYLGGEYLREAYPNSEAAGAIGEIAGGFAPATLGVVSPTRFFINKAKNSFDSFVAQFTPEGAKRRVAGRGGRATTDKDAVRAGMKEETLPGLTPAGQSGNQSLVDLTASVDNALNDADKFLQKSNEKTMTNLREAMTFGGNADDADVFFQEQQRRLAISLRDTVDIAATRAETRIAAMSPRMGVEEANNIAAQEMRDALQRSKQVEDQLYSMIDQNAITPTSTSKSTYRNIFSETPQAQREDIPAIATQFLGSQDSSFGSQTTVSEMRGLQSKLREVARNARSGESPNFNKARIAEDLANSITDDLKLTQGDGNTADQIQTAVKYSSDQSKLFRQGKVGELLGYSKTGAGRVEPGLFLSRSLGLSPERAREAFDDIIAAADTPEMREATNSFITNKFLNYSTTPDGEFSPRRAATFLKNNQEILSRFPQLKDQFVESQFSKQVADDLAKRTSRINLYNPNKSYTAMFIKQGPDAAFNKAFQSKAPSVEVLKLVNLAKKDDSGRALSGLKQGLSDYIYQNARSGEFISGAKLSEFMGNEKNIRAMRAVYSPDEMKRWSIIKRTADRLDMQRGASTSAEVLNDQPSVIATKIAGFLGAAYGSKVARNLGVNAIQIPGQTADTFRELVARGIDPARRLLEDAVQDEDLFRDVLLSSPVEGSLSKKATNRLNAWIATVLAETEQDEQ